MDWFPAEKAVFNVWKVSTSLPGRFNLICTMCTAHIHETDLEKTLRLIFMSNFYSKLETNDCYRVPITLLYKFVRVARTFKKSSTHFVKCVP